MPKLKKTTKVYAVRLKNVDKALALFKDIVELEKKFKAVKKSLRKLIKVSSYPYASRPKHH